MTSASKQRKKGISIHMIHLIMIICTIVIAGLLFYSTYRSSEVFSTLNTETGNYIVRQKAAQDLMKASDYLTEMVQRFTLEADSKYLDNYFEEAFVSKRRESAIVTMANGNTDSEIVQQIQEAMDESQTLMYREYYAMKLMIEAEGVTDYPQQLKEIELSEKDAFLSAEDKAEKARNMVMGTEYYASKEIIRNRLQASLEDLDQMMTTARQNTAASLMNELRLERIIVVILMVILIAMIFLTAKLSTIPLISAAEKIKKREEIPVIGSREFRELAEGYNEMHASLYEHISGQQDG